MAYAKKKDTNHNEIIAALRGVGAAVQETYQYPGMLDVIVGFRGHLYWGDVKYGKGEITEAERRVIDEFARVGITLHIWRSSDEALRTIGAIE